MDEKELEQLANGANSDNNVEGKELTEDELVESLKAEAQMLQQPETENNDNSPVNDQSTENNPEPNTTENKELENNKDAKTSQVFTPVKLVSKGLEIDVTSMDELIQLANQGLNYTQKTQTLSEHRRTVEYMKQHNISNEDLHLIADLKSGNKEVITALAKTYGVDPYELDMDKQYTPNQSNKMAEYNPVDDVANEILQDVELSTNIKNLMTYVPDSFREKLASSADNLRGFAGDVKSGLAQKIIPEAVKLHALNPSMDFLDAYVHAGQRVLRASQNSAPAQQEVKTEAPAQKSSIEINSLKAKAAVTGSSSSGDSNDDDLDIWADGLSDAELVKRIQAKANKIKQ